jgi:basic membrane protein A
MAGYAAVKDGYTKLGFMGGMAVPAVIRFGFGFAQGAEYAAADMGIDAIELKYHYTGNFDATPENQTMAASWYGAGTEVIFAAGGKVGNSVMAAAEAADAKVIGVDVDQSSESDTVITSAKKELAVTVQAGLAGFYAGEFKGGIAEWLDITVDAVGLPFSGSRFMTFTEAEYNAIYAALVADTDGIRSGILDDTEALDADDKASVMELPLTIVSVTEFK